VAQSGGEGYGRGNGLVIGDDGLVGEIIHLPELFLVKLNNLDHLTSHEQLAILRHYQEYLRTEEAYLESGRRRIIEGEFDIPEDQRTHVLEIVSFRLSRVEGQIDWIERKIARIENKEEASS
jgi:hypothetical protein